MFKLISDYQSAPRVSAIIPARNEEANIAACVRSLLAQGLPGDDLEIIVADDDSEDRTAEIVREIAASNSGVQLIAVPPLPEGWLGKTHALCAAVEQARGEWLLFTDADTRHEPGRLAGVVERAEREGLDLVSFSPRQERREWWDRAVIPRVFEELERLYPFSRVNDPKDPLAAANGQYILVRRKVYQAVGGHGAVRSEVVEDVELARRVKGAGFRIWFGSGEGVVRARMYRRLPDLVEGWQKNLFPLYNRDYGAMCRTSLRLGGYYVLPASLAVLAGIWSPPSLSGLGGLAILCLAIEHALYWWRLPDEAAWKKALETFELVPGAVFFLLLLWSSAALHRRGREIEWKGRRYRVGPAELSPSGKAVDTRQVREP
jgi:glycosyltransferase involved in cell wall biosynthesis